MLDFESLSERARSRWIFWTLALSLGAMVSPLLLPAVSDVVASLVARNPLPPPAPLVPRQTSPSMPPPFPGTDSSVQSTAQKLQLVAVTLGASPKSGQVQIGTHRQYAQTYGVGSVLANGATIEEIYYDRVVLRRGTERTELRLAAAGPSSALTQIAPIAAARPTTAENTSGDTPPSAPAAATFEQSVSAQPVYDGAVLRGLEVSAGLPPGDPATYGLARGDVITAIEGSPVADAVDAWQQLAAAASTRGSVTVRRAGKLQTVRLEPASAVTQ